jgi:hypothetical protein
MVEPEKATTTATIVTILITSNNRKKKEQIQPSTKPTPIPLAPTLYS